MRRLLIATAIALAPAYAVAQADEVIAAFGGVELRVSDLRKLLAAQPPLVRRQLAESPAALERLARTEVFRRALAAEARAKGWDKRPEAIERMERAREQALVSSYMDSLARPAADFPSDRELREAYDANRAQLTVPRQYRVARIRDGKAEELGWLAETQVLPEVARALTALKPGETSAPIQTASGAHVVKLHEVREPSLRPFEEVRGELAAALRLRRAQENEQRHFDEMLKKNPIAVNEVMLMRLKNELASAR
jgi:peptidylprolyl isomerase